MFSCSLWCAAAGHSENGGSAPRAHRGVGRWEGHFCRGTCQICFPLSCHCCKSTNSTSELPLQKRHFQPFFLRVRTCLGVSCSEALVYVLVAHVPGARLRSWPSYLDVQARLGQPKDHLAEEQMQREGLCPEQKRRTLFREAVLAVSLLCSVDASPRRAEIPASNS